MTNTLVRSFVSLAVGLLLALPVLGVLSITSPDIANAQALEAEDLLPSEFGEASGLGEADLENTVANLIRVVLGFLGIIAVVMVLWGGFRWMTAGGSQEKVDDAKKILIAGVIGLAIILAAYAITSFVVGALVEATQ
ncbi:MAG: pilin [bacterium]